MNQKNEIELVDRTQVLTVIQLYDQGLFDCEHYQLSREENLVNILWRGLGFDPSHARPLISEIEGRI